MHKKRPEYLDILRTIFILAQQSEKMRPEVPPLRQEIEEAGVEKKSLKEIEREGWVATHNLLINDGNSSSGRVAYCLTIPAMLWLEEVGIAQRPVETPEVAIEPAQF